MESNKVKLILPGREDANAPKKDTQLDEFLKVEVLAQYTVGDSARDATRQLSEAAPQEADESDVVELEFENGVTRLVPVSLLREESAQIAQHRGAGLGESDPNVIRVPAAYARAGETRGFIKDFLLDAVKVLSPKLPSKDSILEDLKSYLPDNILANLAAKGLARLIAVYFEGLSFNDGQVKIYGGKLAPGPGLYRFTNPKQLDERERITQSSDLKDGDAWLVFLHGTASSSAGSYGGLGGTTEWTAMQNRYGNRILAFNHPTFSLSPIENAIELSKLLPANAKLHMVSHSRGGLVGEALSLLPVTGDELKKLVKPFSDTGRKEDEEQLRELIDIIGQKRFQIERFVRVACPARGTILASKRMDVLFNGVLNAVKWAIGGDLNPYFRFAKALALALLKCKANPADLPGLEAMMPESPFIHMLNRPDLKTTADLTVIAGDIEGSGILGNLLVGMTNLYYLEQHDLVVNTDAMYGGIKREREARFFFDQGAKVSHFNYFSSDKTRGKLLSGLEGRTDQGFEALKRELKLDITPSATRAASEDNDRPVVFILPGIMGSHLKDKDGRVWIDMAALAMGGIGRLAIDAETVKPDGVVGQSYKALVEYLGERYRVIPFAYDWRLSVKTSGALLAEAVREELKAHQQPVRFLAHSMGGLVARAGVALDQEMWKEICRRGGRLVMLGAPNQGAYAISRLLLGREKLLRMLDLLDYSHDLDELMKIICCYPGWLEMAPKEFLDPGKWNEIKKVNKDLTAPDAKLLEQAKSVRKELEAAVDPKHMVSVAGNADLTPCDVSIGDGRVEFKATPLGDGWVTYDLGKLDGLDQWFMDAEHGDLANHKSAFPALMDLLETGETNKLSRAQKTVRGVTAATVLPDDDPLIFPTEEEFVTAAFGSAARKTEAHTLRISVTHGDLRYASYPVAVGHYQGDSIVSAEAILDQAMKGRLTQRFQAGIYPGADGTAEAVHAPKCNPPGALVIGLGEVGELTPEKLRDGVTRVALRHAMAVMESPEAGAQTQSGWRSAAFSTLMLGTYGGNALTVESSLAAVVQGAIQANRALQAQNLWDRVRIDEVEVIELYEDMAIQAIHAAHDLIERPPLELNQNERIEVAQNGLISKEGGRFQRPTNQYLTGWWRRIQITGEQDGRTGAAVRGLRFLALTDRARAEDVAQATQRRLIDGFVTEAIQSSSLESSRKLGLTLFELLAPNTLKDQFSAQTDMVLVLDKDAAQYPWELLAERTGDDVQHLALKKGLIRQFKTADFRPDPQPARDRNALVIGDTVNNISPLPGARQEAEIVAEMLKDSYRGDHVNSLIERKAKDVITGLFEKDYSIIHLAGHGLYDPQSPEQSGMVLSDGLCLSTAEIRQLRVVPEMVFINCCHLGNIDKSEEGTIDSLISSLAGFLIKEGATAMNAPAFSLAERMVRMGLDMKNDQERLRTEIGRELVAVGMSEQRDPDKLAARVVVELVRLRVARNAHNVYASSISEELIKMGVKAVVAAGWAVDDAAASTFAKTFYTEMLGGGTFGDAVLAARKTTYTLHRNANTWGAYQCYGNPGFKLVQSPSVGAWKGRQTIYLSQREYLDKLRNIAATAKNADTKRREELGQQIDRLRQEILPRWLDGRMLSAFANAWSELGDLGKAIELYRQAIQEENATASLKDIEQLANLEHRHATQLLRDKRRLKEAIEMLEESNKRIEWMMRIGPSVERLSLLGGNYKRLARYAKDEEWAELLKKAEENYGKAERLALQRPGSEYYYAALNWAACHYLLDGHGRKKGEQEALDQRVITVIEESRKDAARREKTYWTRVTGPDTLLLEILVNDQLAGQEEQVINSYREVFRTGATQRERESTLDHMGFLIEMLKHSKRQERKETAKALNKIRKSLSES